MKGLLVDIYTNPSYRSCSCGGISEKHNEALLVGPGIPEIFEAGNRPVLQLCKGNLPGTAKIVPIDLIGNRMVMFGGAYVASSDGRFTSAVEAITGHRFYGAIPLHDRVEREERR